MIDWLVGGCCGPGGALVWTAPSWVPAVAALAVFAVLALALRPFPRGLARWAEVALLALAGVVAVFASGGPVWLQEGERVEEGRFVVLVDASRSMRVLDADGNPRSDRAKGLLRGLGTAEVYSFGEALRPGAPEAYDQGDSDLGGALAALSQRYAGEKLQGVAVITDGIDRGGLRRRVMGDAAQTTGASVTSPLPRLGGPLTLYQVGQNGERLDVSVTDLRAGGFAFLRAPFGIEVDVQAVGTHMGSVPVALTRDGRPAGTLSAKLDANGRGTVRFEITPDTPGRYVYEASVPTVEGDAVPANNALSMAVRVVRDRVRVLQVSGSPSWDQKFLRLFLKEDPSVDLVSFFILRTTRDMGAGWDSSELSLIHFPYRQLFSLDDDLTGFDLVVLQNFDYAPYFENMADRLLADLAEYVRRGGALVMIGGDRSFDLGEYGRTPLADVLPVTMGVTGEGVDATSFSPRLTASGARHPITQLVADPSENAAVWQRLSPLDGLNLSMGATPDAAVLLEHPTLAADGKPLPVLAVREVGEGRTMALMGDSSWRWSFAEAGQGHGNQAYLRFWKNAMRWLIGDPEDQPLAVEAGRENYQVGEDVRLRVQVRDVAFQPLAGAAVRVRIDGPGGATTAEAVSDAEGVAVVTTKAVDRGAFRVRVSAADARGTDLGTAATVFAVTTRDPELDEVEPDAAFLKTLAARTGGKYVGPDESEPPLRDPDAGRRVRDRRETPLYAAPLVPALFGLFASASWWLRRRSGFR